MKQYKKHSTNNTEHSIYKYTYYQNTHTLQNKIHYSLTSCECNLYIGNAALECEICFL